MLLSLLCWSQPGLSAETFQQQLDAAEQLFSNDAKAGEAAFLQLLQQQTEPEQQLKVQQLLCWALGPESGGVVCIKKYQIEHYFGQFFCRNNFRHRDIFRSLPSNKLNRIKILTIALPKNYKFTINFDMNRNGQSLFNPLKIQTKQ